MAAAEAGGPQGDQGVAFRPFPEKGRSGAERIDVLTGFVDAKGGAMGRPVGVVVDGRGALLVADDVGNTVWRVKRNEAPGD
jgi:glucose/arabinose dehydrogenase